MAATVKKQTGSQTRIVIRFDSPPSLDELKSAINKTDVADRGSRISKVLNAGDVATTAPVKFVFQVESETEVDVP